MQSRGPGPRLGQTPGDGARTSTAEGMALCGPGLRARSLIVVHFLYSASLAEFSQHVRLLGSGGRSVRRG